MLYVASTIAAVGQSAPEDMPSDSLNSYRPVYSDYPYIDMDANHIDLNGADWSNVIDAFSKSDEKVLNIVHIGDSHIQADIATSKIRDIMQDAFGMAGRGLVVPHRMTGSNEADDYTFVSHGRFEPSRLVGKGSKLNVGFTGVGLTRQAGKFDIRLSARTPFERLRLFYGGAGLILVSAFSDEVPLIVAVSSADKGSMMVDMPFAVDNITLNLSALGPVSLYGAEIMSDVVGVAYHTIGINGASFSSYLQIEDMGERVAALSPDLIVVSLGTNDAMGRFSREVTDSNIARLCDELMSNNPQARLLLLTPSEVQRRIRLGKKRRSSYSVCSNIEKVADAIRHYGRDNSVAVYDWYKVSGGGGSSTKWLKDGLLSRDRVHDTRLGYELAGELMAKALLDVLGATGMENDEQTTDTEQP